MKKAFLAGGMLAVLVLLVFGQSVGHEYVMWDDRGNVYDNPQIPLEAPLSEVGAFWEKPFVGFYIPVVYTVWAGIAAVSEEAHYPETGKERVFSARLFHGANVLLHLLSTWMVFAIVYRLLGRRDAWAAALGAAVFAVHPLQVEAVAWVTGLKDVLSAFFGLACTLVYLRQAELLKLGRGKEARRRFWASVALLVAALLCKTHLIALPVALLWLEFVVAKTPLRTLLWKFVPFAAVGAVFTAITFWGQFEAIPIIGSPVEEKIALWKRAIVALDAVGFYLAKVFYPFGLAPEYGRRPEVALDFSRLYPLWAAVPVILGGMVWWLRRRAILLAGLLVAAVTLAPVLGLVQFGYQGHSTVADRYVYFPMVGVALLVGGALTIFGQGARVRRRVFLAGGLIVVMGLAVVSSRQVARWESCSTLFRHCLEVNPESLSAYSNLAAAAANAGRYEEAIVYGERMIEMVPRWSILEATYSETLARDYMTVGRYEEALPLLKRAVELQPGNMAFRRSLEEWGSR